MESGEPAPIQLGRTAPFNLGALSIEPATRQVMRGARRETVEPRVMQVLVALARADGAVVSRDDLVATCWGGVVVGDNAIHRTISRLREVAQTFGPDTFRIETVARVGYRLEHCAAESNAPAPPARGLRYLRSPRGTLGVAFAAIAAVCVAATVGAFVLAGPRRAPAQGPFLHVEGEGGAQSANFARALETDLPGALGRPLNLSLTTPGFGSADKFYTVRVRAETVAASQRAELTLANARSGDLIWSESYDRSSDATGALRLQMASRLAAVLDCTDQAGAGGDQLDPASLRMFVGACAQLPGSPDASVLSLLHAVTQRQPRSATAWAWLSYVEAETADLEDFAPQDDASKTLKIAAEEHRRRAAALGARPGLLSLAEAASIPRIEWRKGLAITEKGIAADPDFGPLYPLYADMLQRVGRMTDAVDSARRGALLAPTNSAAHMALARALAYSGNLAEARDEIAKAERIWPDDPTVRETRDSFDLRFGDPRALLRRIDSGKLLSNASLEFQIGTYRSYLLARADPSPAHVDAAVRDVASMARRKPGAAWLIQLLGSLGRRDDAFRLLERPEATPSIEIWSDTLFRNYMRPMRLDARFMVLAARVGLVTYWRDSGHWPDFCADASLPYDCKAEGTRAEAALRQI